MQIMRIDANHIRYGDRVLSKRMSGLWELTGGYTFRFERPFLYCNNGKKWYPVNTESEAEEIVKGYAASV